MAINNWRKWIDDPGIQCAYNKGLRNKKHQGKNSLVCIYVSPPAITASLSDVTCDANETESMFLYIILTRPGKGGRMQCLYDRGNYRLNVMCKLGNLLVIGLIIPYEKGIVHPKTWQNCRIEHINWQSPWWTCCIGFAGNWPHFINCLRMSAQKTKRCSKVGKVA